MRDQPLPKTILILSVNPKGTDPLRLDEEVREIKAGIQRSRHRDQYIIQHQMAAQPRDVQRAMLDFMPQIVHFCGHGAGENGLIFKNDSGMIHPVSASALSDLFALFADPVECVLLNACYSEVQAEAIARHIPAVIGMNQVIGDRAAIEFATSFYDALGAGQTVEFAFRLGKNAMLLAGIAEENTPVLLQKVAAPIVPEIVTAKGRSQIFISYKRGFSPDEAVALEVYAALSQQHSVFIDQTMPAGTRWAEQIEAELRRSDFLIVFLTANSVISEMVKSEIEMAHHLSEQQGKPSILPVRLAYREPFTYPLSAYLNPINWAFWQSPADTPRLIEELQRAIAGESLSINSDRAKTDLTTALESEIQNPNKELITLRKPHRAQCFTEPEIQLDLMLIPGSTFTMGSPPEELERYDDEGPRHDVTVSSFLMGRYPVTQSQWRAIATRTDLKVNHDLDPDPSQFKGEDRPVEQVSWHEATEFCNRLFALTGHTYRLPTEAEWEYACRAGTTTPFHFGKTITTHLANYRGEDSESQPDEDPGHYGKGAKAEYRKTTTPVTHFHPLANAFGLCDMHGNVLEWCLDHWHDNYQGAPTDGSAWLTENNNSRRVLRGGSWDYSLWGCRSASRYYSLPGFRNGPFGFRVLCEARGL